MERVWRRVQGAGRRGSGGGVVGRCGCPTQPCQLHVDQRAKRGGGVRKSRGPQTIVCGCQVQPCPVHPVLIRVRRTQRPPSSCDCPPDSLPCPHTSRVTVSRRVRRCDCTERPCRHMSSSTRRRPQGISSILPLNPVVQIINPVSSCECPDKSICPHIDEDCECEARPCCHTIKTRRPRRSCDCPSQPCPHKPVEGRIKRVKCRVRRAGCAMARCTAELAMLHLHWELASECAPCKPRALTRRLCRRQQSDNELYRSNSFKFERFERNKDECSTSLRKQIIHGQKCPFVQMLLQENTHQVQNLDMLSENEDEEMDLLFLYKKQKEYPSTSLQNNWERELNLYSAEERAIATTDVLNWWKEHQNQYPDSACMARDFLAVPATSVPSERLFSRSSLTIRKHRNRLNDKSITSLMCLNSWVTCSLAPKIKSAMEK